MKKEQFAVYEKEELLKIEEIKLKILECKTCLMYKPEFSLEYVKRNIMGILLAIQK